MRILGLSGGYHDAAAAIVCDGRLVAAAQEERFSRRKHDASFPIQAAGYCLAEAGIAPGDLDAIAWYEDPRVKFQRIVHGYFAAAPRGYGRFRDSLPAWLGDRLWVRRQVARQLGVDCPVRYVPHHLSHAASAYLPSGFAEAAILTVDGVGEWTTNAIWKADAGGIMPLREQVFPHSLGLFYSAFTAYCGFRINDGEYKLMGLAALGRPRLAQAIREQLIEIHADGSYRLDMRCFAYEHSDAMMSERLYAVLGARPRAPGAPISEHYADVAASVQTVLEEVLLKQARYAREITSAKDLCMAGGVALNCVANTRLLREAGFDRVWVQPASGDAGGALGAALACAWTSGEIGGATSGLQAGSLLGPAYDDEAIEAELQAAGVGYERFAPEELTEIVADALAASRIVGWFQGRMEFGPRALGNRSILADPRDPDMKARLNARIKHRESYRPFAPIVLQERAGRFFDHPTASPYMLFVAPVREDCALPAVTHDDGTARLQTVSADSNPPIERLLRAFERRTGSAVLVNTSFNDADEPIVCTPRDALRSFLRTHLDLLAIGSFIVRQPDDRLRESILASEVQVPSQPRRRSMLGSTVLMPLFFVLVILALPYRILTAITGRPRRGWRRPR